MNSIPKMTKQHFQYIAMSLQKAILKNHMSEEQADWLVNIFIADLSKTNPAFNASLFAQVAKGIP